MNGKTFKLLMVGDGNLSERGLGSLLKNAHLAWEVEYVRDHASALEKISLEKFDICLLDKPSDKHGLKSFMKSVEFGPTAIIDIHRDDCLAAAIGAGCETSDRRGGVFPDTGSFPLHAVEVRLLAAMLAHKQCIVDAQEVNLESNSSVRAALHERGEATDSLRKGIEANLKQAVFPYIQQLKNSFTQNAQKGCLDALEHNIREIFSPFLRNLSTLSPELTHSEIKVAELIREGKSSKEAAQILGVSEKTVLSHRYNLRTKLRLRNRKVGLKSFLMSLE